MGLFGISSELPSNYLDNWDPFPRGFSSRVKNMFQTAYSTNGSIQTACEPIAANLKEISCVGGPGLKVFLFFFSFYFN